MPNNLLYGGEDEGCKSFRMKRTSLCQALLSNDLRLKVEGLPTVYAWASGGIDCTPLLRKAVERFLMFTAAFKSELCGMLAHFSENSAK
jgi:hypothetical protein